MATTWIAFDDIPSARLRVPNPPESRNSQPYYRLHSSDDKERAKSSHEPLTSDVASPLPTQGGVLAYDRNPLQFFLFRGAFWRQTWRDVRNFPWRRIGRRCLSGPLMAVLILGLMAPVTIMSWFPFAVVNYDGGGCSPDGDFLFDMDSSGWTPWTRSSAFAVNIKFGTFTFGTAKLIDVIWDVVCVCASAFYAHNLIKGQGVGRGGQAVLAFIAYGVFTSVLRQIMEGSPVHYRTFKAITLQNDRMAGLANLTKGAWAATTPRLKVASLWMIIAGAFVLFTPTWLSAMTGYTAAVTLYTQDSSDSRVLSTNFMPVFFVVHDGARLGEGFTDEDMVAVPWDFISWGEFQYYWDSYEFDFCASGYSSSSGFYSFQNASEGGEMIWEDGATLACKKLYAVAEYLNRYDPLDRNASTKTTFHKPDESNLTKKIELSPPGLDISTHFPVPSKNFDTHIDKDQLRQRALIWESSSKTSYNLTEFADATLCQQLGDIVKYRWGFSFLLLYFYLIALIIWSIGMWICFLYTRFHADPKLAKRNMGIERAVIDIAHAMEETLDTAKEPLQGNAELRALSADVRLSYLGLCDSSNKPGRRLMSYFYQWLRGEIWWLIAFVFCLAMFCLSLVGKHALPPVSGAIWLVWSPWFSSLPLAGTLLPLTAGRDVASRWVLAAPFLLLFLILDFYWICQVEVMGYP